MTISDDLDDAFVAAERRMAALRYSPREFVIGPAKRNYVTYWRSRNSLNRQCPSDGARTKVLRWVELELGKEEQERAKQNG